MLELSEASYVSQIDSDTTASQGEYVIRKYRPGDVEGIMELDRVVWERDRRPAWFMWKYVRNPYVEEVPVFVAERDGQIVGARPLMAFQIRSGEQTRTALQPADTMVHPDHRQRGLFTRMTELAIETYESRHPGFFFNFPNRQSWPGYEKLDWRSVAPRVTYYRVERPSAFLGGIPVRRALGWMIDQSAGAYVQARRVAANGADDELDVGVERVIGTPIDRIEDLYELAIPDEFHANRSAEFLKWCFSSPAWTRQTYVATSGGEDVAGIVSRTRINESGTVITQIIDMLPLVGGAQRRAAIRQLLNAMIADHRRTDVFSVASATVPPELLTSLGFLPDDRLPLSRLTSNDVSLATRPFDVEAPDAWTWNGRRLDRSDNWLLSFVERDTA